MRCMVLGVCLVLAWAPTLRADDTKPDKKDLTPAEQVKKLIDDYQKGQEDFRKLLGETKDPEERAKLISEKMPKPDKVDSRLLELAEKNPKDEGVVPAALIWVVQQGKSKDKAVDLLVGYADNPKLADLCVSLSRSPSANAKKLLRAILEKNPSEEAQGKACYALATAIKNDGATKEAEELLEKAAAKYADVPLFLKTTVGDKASGELFEMRHLAIGMTVPEIEGEDLDGNKLKLSEYRGKVVVIDFWGNW